MSWNFSFQGESPPKCPGTGFGDQIQNDSSFPSESGKNNSEKKRSETLKYRIKHPRCAPSRVEPNLEQPPKKRVLVSCVPAEQQCCTAYQIDRQNPRNRTRTHSCVFVVVQLSSPGRSYEYCTGVYLHSYMLSRVLETYRNTIIHKPMGYFSHCRRL